jgi:Ca2+-binding EF-hand superfamily protein
MVSRSMTPGKKYTLKTEKNFNENEHSLEELSKLYGLKEKQILIYQSLFENFSANKKHLTPGELRNLIQHLGINLNSKEISDYMSDFDSKEMGNIDFEDFIKIITDRTKPFENDTKRRKMEVFREISRRNQVISLDDFENSFFKNGFNITKEEIKEIYEFMREKMGTENENEEVTMDFQNFDKFVKNLHLELNKFINNEKF